MNYNLKKKRHSTLQIGGISSAIVNLSCFSIGVGCLTLSNAIKRSGILVGLVWNLTALVLVYWSSKLLVECMVKTGFYNFTSIMKYLFWE
jgi:amino acid permease